MADAKIVNIKGVQWDLKDEVARNKINEQNTSITNLATEINEVKSKYERFYYNANTDKNVLQNRIDAMIYCYNNSKSSYATIRYKEGYYHNVMIPAADLSVRPEFIEIDYYGNINIIEITDRQNYAIVRTI